MTTRMMKVVSASLLSACVLMPLCGCSSGNDAQTNGGGSGSVERGQQLASSIGELAETLLRQEGDEMAPEQKARVERVRDEGKVSVADYEKSWSDFKQCMVDKGYNTPLLTKYPNGVYQIAPTDQSAMSQSQSKQYDEDYIECYGLYAIDVNALYNKQISNPSLYSDPNRGVADCLVRQGLVDASYDAKAFKQDFDKFPESTDTVVDFDDPQVRACMAGNNMLVYWGDEQEWKPLG